MSRIFRRLICLTAAMLLPLSAIAEPVLTHGGYTAWIGENDWLYLQDPQGIMKYMRSAMTDLPAMNDDTMWCVTSTGSLWSVKLDGSGSAIVSQQADQLDIEGVKPQPRWALTAGTVTIAVNALRLTNVLAACELGDTLYYVSQEPDEQPLLHTAALAGVMPLLQVPGVEVGVPVSMMATEEAITIMTVEGTVQVIDPITLAVHTLGIFPDITAAAVINGSLLGYTGGLDEASWHYEWTRELTDISGSTIESISNAVSYLTVATATPRPTARPTATPTPRPTVRPTAKPTARPTARPTAVPDDDDGTIRKGQRGSAVKAMQRRLSKLGYPVGKIDGAFGDNTLFALNLFQFAIGYTERTYATESCLKRLNAKTAPVYDPYLPLVKGDRGTPVRLMQEALAARGFFPGKIDGIYGSNTVQALQIFQVIMGLPIDGTIATAECLMALYGYEPTTPSDLDGIYINPLA